MKRLSAILAAVLPVMNAAFAAPHPTADLLILHGDVRTQAPAQPRAEAVAVLGRQIVAVGSSADLRAWAGPHTRVLDAAGRLVLPGFNDAHVHFLSGGFQLTGVDLRDTDSPQAMARRLGTFAASRPQGEWITGGNWDHENWPGAPLPTRALLDPVTPGSPVLISRLDGHMALANTLALTRAGVSKDTPDPPGGTIVRDPHTGEPTGLLKDAALGLVTRHIPPPDAARTLAAARAASAHAASLGVTSVQDMSAGADIAVYQELLRRGELQTRIYAMTPLAQWTRLAAVGVQAALGSDFLRVGGLKAFADGSLGSTTALFFAPYADAPDTWGLPSDEMFPPGALLERVLGADAAGLQVMIHAIGDRANHEVLSLFEEALARHGPRPRRFRIEHAQHLRTQDIPRFARAGVIASVQPYHCADDGRWAEKRIGPERCRTTYAFRSLLDAGVTLAFGSDWTVAPLNPMLGVAAAVTRRTLDGRHPDGWIAEQKISVAEAIRAYTVGSAFAEHTDAVKGTLAPGQLADLVVWDRNPYTGDPADLDRARPVWTVVDGRVVYGPGP